MSTALHVALSLTEMAAATPAPCPVTVQHIMLRVAACDILSPATHLPATSRFSTFCGTVMPKGTWKYLPVVGMITTP